MAIRLPAGFCAKALSGCRTTSSDGLPAVRRSDMTVTVGRRAVRHGRLISGEQCSYGDQRRWCGSSRASARPRGRVWERNGNREHDAVGVSVRFLDAQFQKAWSVAIVLGCFPRHGFVRCRPICRLFRPGDGDDRATRKEDDRCGNEFVLRFLARYPGRAGGAFAVPSRPERLRLSLPVRPHRRNRVLSARPGGVEPPQRSSRRTTHPRKKGVP